MTFMCVDRMEDAEAKVKIQKELDMDRTERLVKKEYERSEKWQKEQISAVQKRSDNIKTLSKRAENQITQAKIGHANTLKKLQKTKAERTVLIEEMDELEKAHQADRLEAVLQTKADTDMARIKAAKDSDQHQKKLARAAQELEDEKEILLAKGKNPYTEFRRREFKSDAAKQERNMRESVRMNKAKLGESLIVEERGRFREEAAEAKAKAYEKMHRDEQGRHVTEERNSKYIASVMSGGHEVLDPSGRAPRVDPSQVTDIKDHSFGLKKACVFLQKV